MSTTDGPLHLPPERRTPEAIQDFMIRRLAEWLQLEPSAITPEQGILELGLDSVAVASLTGELEAWLRRRLPPTILWKHPSIARLARHLAQLSERPEGSGSGVALTAAPLPTEFPLSAAQGALWLSQQLAPQSSVLNVAFAVRIAPPLDVAALRRALATLVQRHPALRTTFELREGRPLQRVQPQAGALEELDAAGWSEQELSRRVNDEANRPFELSRAVFAATLFLRPVDGDVLLLRIHHLAIDFWSLVILAQELFTLYPAELAGGPSALPPIPFHYADFVRWQEALLAGEEGAALEEYWTRQLADCPAALELPTDWPRPPVRTFRGGAHPFHVPAPLVARLKRLARQEGTTLYAAILAGFQTLLHRYTGQKELVVGSPAAGRVRVGLGGVVGCFVNALVLRADFSSEPTFRALLGQVGRTVLEGLEHQLHPFARLVERVQPVRDSSRAPLFQAMFVLERPQLQGVLGLSGLVLGGPGARAELGGLHLSAFPLETRTTQFELTLVMVEVEGGMHASLQYNADLFEAGTAARMAGHLLALLEGAVSAPEAPVSRLPLLDAEERRRIVETWNDTASDFPREGNLQALVEEQARRRPDAVAVAYGERRLTYRELDRRANQLAHHLMKRGVRRNVLVGICLERSPELIVGLLGILKAGGAYVPLDPGYPRERLAWMIEDTRAPVIVTQERFRESLPAGRAALLCLDADSAELSRESEAPPSRASSGRDLAYVMYTSGSTGRPKGVCIPHRAILRLLVNTNYVELGPEDRIAQASNASFDAATFEIWGALIHGGRLVGLDKDTLLSPRGLAAALREQSVSILFVTTALFNQVAAEQPEAFGSLRQLMFGGEAVDPRAVRRVLAAGAPRRLLHVYGPTECTTFASWHLVKEVAEGATTVPIGRPLANTTLYILDAWRQPVPVGVVGELFIGGPGLAHGYLHQPELTEEKFVDSPFEPSARLYRTGDLARFRPDGSVEFVGRADTQVKIRGFRIELAEIETILGGHPAVRESVAVVREEGPGGKQLVAYVVARPGTTVVAAELRAFLAGRVPEYMVPAAFVALEALPLTPNGKVDRRALPAPRWEEEGAAPSTETERRLAALWSDVLGVAGVRRHQDFFELGGHSLLATRLATRIEESFGVALPLRVLFERTTVARQAEAVEQTLAARSTHSPIPRLPRTGPALLSFAQERLWFLEQLVPGSPAYNIPGAVRLKGRLDVPALERCLGELVRRHEILRTTYTVEPSGPVQRVGEAWQVPLPVVELAQGDEAQREAEVTRHATEEAVRPFELSRGPVLRARLLRLGEAEHVLLVTVHHIAADGWSLEVLIREVAALYASFSEGRPSELPELPLQYADFAAWQRTPEAGTAWPEQLAYWKKQLDGVPVLDLPTDRPRPAVQSFRGARYKVALPPSLRRGLEALSAREGVTPFMAWLAAFQVLLGRYSGQTDIAVGAPVANRRRKELEGLIGLFVNTLVLRTDLSGDPSFRTLLGRVREVALGAYSNQDIPFDRVVEAINPTRALSHGPLFEVLFSLQEAPASALSLRGLELQPLEVEGGSTKAALSLTLETQGEGMSAALQYSAELFDASTIERMLRHWVRLIEAIIAEPERPISRLPLLADAERRRLLEEWSGSREDWPEGTLHQFVEAHAARRPGATAVVFEGQALSYGELDRRANQLARHLRGLGVGPEVPVALLLERSLEMVVGMLGVLKAGGFFVPLEPEYPRERLEYMLRDCGARIVLMQQRLESVLSTPGVTRLALDADWERVARHPDEPLDGSAGPSPEALAYVIYTSGSTGKPKGAMVTHRAIRNHVFGMVRTLSLGEDSALVLKTPFSFDASLWEAFTALGAGARLIVARPGGHRDVPYLVRLCREERVTDLMMVPSLLQLFLEEPSSSELGALVRVCCGGEALSQELRERFFQKFGARVALRNYYGPTEAAVAVTSWRCGPEDAGRRTVPIGRPFPNTRLYVLDANLEPQPVGVVGELYIGGVQVGRGYWGRPELTAERFVHDPFSSTVGARLYRTGDLVRWLADGSLEYLGRADQQVKVRGFRIELAEIEACLARHPAVRQVAVGAREVLPGDKRLVAWLVLEAGRSVASAELQAFVAASLPEYMVPSAFVVIAELPLSPGGKVDLRALPAPGFDSHEPTAFRAPGTPTEQRLADLWRELLGVARVGLDDDFFALGGHSLVAMRLRARITLELGVELPLSTLFQTPVLGALAHAIDQAIATQGRSATPAIPRVSREARRARLSDLKTPGGGASQE